MSDNNQTLRVLQSMDKEDDSIRILQCEGYLNFETYDYIKGILARMFRSGIYKIIFDLQDIKYISSSGWSVFLGPLEVARASGGDLKLAAMPDEVKFVFEALELGNIISLYDTVDKAAESFKKK
jgi:anti-sigma B factor antagonist